MKKYPIFIAGPTGIGKTDLAQSLASHLGLKIISCDSIQVYQGLDIGSNKYKPNTFCLDLSSPLSKFDVEDFVEYCTKFGEMCIIVGGSGFYMERVYEIFGGLKIFLYMDRICLYRKLDLRCEEMIKNGFLFEVLELKKSGLHKGLPAGRAIGYRDALDFLNSDINEHNFYLFLEKFKTRTRNLVRRQEIYMRKRNYLWIDVGKDDPFAEVICILDHMENICTDKYKPPVVNYHRITRLYRSELFIYRDTAVVMELIDELKSRLV